jgi:hypothetical protein
VASSGEALRLVKLACDTDSDVVVQVHKTRHGTISCLLDLSQVMSRLSDPLARVDGELGSLLRYHVRSMSTHGSFQAQASWLSMTGLARTLW